MRTVLFIAAIFMLHAIVRADVNITLPAAKEERRFVLVEANFPPKLLMPPFAVKDSASKEIIPAQNEETPGGHVVRFLLPHVPANTARTFNISQGTAPKDRYPLMRIEEKDGRLSISDKNREITRYHFGPKFLEKFKKPYFFPVNVAGVNPVRDWPMVEDRKNEPTDHPHHTGVYFAYGEVNGKEYWSKLPIAHGRIIHQAAGEVYARVHAENRWGDDLIEDQDVLILNVGPDAVVMDWTITLKAPEGKPVEFGQTKEGGFSVRVTDGISYKDAKANGDENMVDSEGHRGEKLIRNETPGKEPKRLRGPSAPWADDTGVVDGKTVGVTIMNHPMSFRYPGDWHVRAYGLFTANPFFLQGPYTLKPGEPLVLKYRLYFHAGKADEAHVADVFNGYANSKAQ